MTRTVLKRSWTGVWAWACLWVSLALSLLAVPAALADGARPLRHVLVIHSFNDTLPWSRGLTEGIEKGLAGAPFSVELHVEYLDSLRHPLPGRITETVAFLEKKLRGLTIDGILTTDDIALDFTLAYRDRLFDGIPLVFCAPNDFSPARIKGHRRITGVVESPDFDGTLRLIRHLHPTVEDIYVITDRTPASLKRLADFNKTAAQWKDRLRFTVSTDDGWAALMNELAGRPARSALIYLNFLKDRSGGQYGAGTEVLARISAATTLPIYTYKKIDVGHGAVGGSVISEVLMAQHAARMMRLILEGAAPEDIPVVTRTPTVRLFDYPQLQRHAIGMDRLPAGSVVINRPFSFYETYRQTVWWAGSVIVLLALLTTLLSVAILRRSRVEKALREAGETLEVRVSERTTALQRANDDLTREIAIRRAAEEALRENEERYRALSEATFEAIFIWEKGYCRDTNRTACRMFGYDHDELIGVFGTDIIAEESWEIVRDRVISANAQPYEALARRKDGSPFHVEICGRMSEFRGRPVLVTVVRDIDAQKRAAQEKASLEARLHHAQKMEALGTLAGGVAHDFNNLLMSISGNATLVKCDLSPEHPFYPRLTRIEEGVGSAAKLTAQLLGYARKGTYELTSVDLNKAVREVGDTMGRTHKHISIELELEPRLPAIRADATQIAQILFNLCINAVDAMPDGGRLLLQTAATETDPELGEAVVIRVSDTGIGIAADTLPRIFDPFFTTKEMGRGTGLGLASVHGVVAAHGGRIDVASQPGRGTTFIIRFPAVDAVVAAAGDNAAGAAVAKGVGTILLVDDEPIVSAVTTDMLTALGYTVITAASGKEAIRCFANPPRPIDLVILDMIMPDMSGSVTFDQIRRIAPDVPVLLSSGSSAQGQAETIMGRGCCGFIQKPFDLFTLAAKINEALRWMNP